MYLELTFCIVCVFVSLNAHTRDFFLAEPSAQDVPGAGSRSVHRAGVLIDLDNRQAHNEKEPLCNKDWACIRIYVNMCDDDDDEEEEEEGGGGGFIDCL